MYKNIVLTGGTTMLRGLRERLEFEVRQLVNTGRDVTEVAVYQDSHRKYATWIGGSMLASMSTFAEFKISQQAYKEAGNKAVVMKKAF